MKTVRTTFLKNQKNRSVYFDEEEDRRAHEQETGCVLDAKTIEYRTNWSFIINTAYNDGFQDGIAEALERAAEEVNDGKAD